MSKPLDERTPRIPRTYPLRATTMDEARELQERLVSATAKHMPHAQMFIGDVGVTPGLGRPAATERVERVLADAFNAQDAALVQGAGTGAIRSMISAGPWRTARADGKDRRILVHDAPAYNTTAHTLADAGAQVVETDFNRAATYRSALEDPDCPDWVYLQHTRQRLDDSYDLEQVIIDARNAGKRVLVDDNYSAVRCPRIGVQMGAAASAFSLFKLHGPEGVGLVLGDHDIIDEVRRANYSGGGQVQGHQALDALRALVMVPLNWAAQTAVEDEVAGRLRAGEVNGIADVTIANVQDRALIALLNVPRARELPEVATEFGSAAYPVGANSRYEITPLVYRLSSSSLTASPELADWAVRINPMRAGADLVIEILKKSMEKLL